MCVKAIWSIFILATLIVASKEEDVSGDFVLSRARRSPQYHFDTLGQSQPYYNNRGYNNYNVNNRVAPFSGHRLASGSNQHYNVHQGPSSIVGGYHPGNGYYNNNNNGNELVDWILNSQSQLPVIGPEHHEEGPGVYVFVPLESLEHHLQLKEHLHELHLEQQQRQEEEQLKLLALQQHNQREEEEELLRQHLASEVDHDNYNNDYFYNHNNYAPLENHDAEIIPQSHPMIFPLSHEDFIGGVMAHPHILQPHEIIPLPLHEVIPELPENDFVHIPMVHHVAHIWTRDGDFQLPEVSEMSAKEHLDQPNESFSKLLLSSSSSLPVKSKIDKIIFNKPPTVLKEVKAKTGSPTLLRETKNDVNLKNL